MTSRSRTLRESQNQRNFDQNLRFSHKNPEKSDTLKEKSVYFARYTTQYKFKTSPKTGPDSKSNPFLPCLRVVAVADRKFFGIKKGKFFPSTSAIF